MCQSTEEEIQMIKADEIAQSLLKLCVKICLLLGISVLVTI